MVSDEDTSIIEAKYIKKLRERELWSPMDRAAPLFVVITCDPNVCGPNHMALVAMINYEGKRVVSIFLFILRII